MPEHCRVTGLIQPEIRFEVNLPSSWNRRFYMNGNGGFAGETSDSPPRAAIRAAALSVTRPGTMPAFALLGELDARVAPEIKSE